MNRYNEMFKNVGFRCQNDLFVPGILSKKSTQKFKSSQMFILGPKIPNILHFGHNENFL